MRTVVSQFYVNCSSYEFDDFMLTHIGTSGRTLIDRSVGRDGRGVRKATTQGSIVRRVVTDVCRQNRGHEVSVRAEDLDSTAKKAIATP